ncbi:class I SAM-dependent methyltransferase [Aspergillus novofumigatus IBT 16806]|uniref:S-adenosyl-L-methionine-dependent methyltransferase n=1 Tax=Aspergillus novofumigatus (strain IBT 16806) TaxID=1392255 RepID=A0A2I1C775_ASPN1|nr:S-adenosyl-L-methionine-dependent methyltransferase [Aspergillus novofumigatus IBT 16806]PKX93488.1 S-adenosyl-L-methionine-dependent methyltransferase [Aspergillus novofumigatus IBT 16806]
MASGTAQNVYDDSTFFNEYGKLPRSQQGLAGAPEWSALRQMTSTIFETIAFWISAAEQGASYIRGVDVADKMIAKAREMTIQPASAGRFAYEIQDLESIVLESAAYDLVFSSLALYYIEDLDRLFRQIYACLNPEGGRLVFSVEHPVMTAPVDPPAEWIKVESGGLQRTVWPLNSYSDEGVRLTDWLYHRMTDTYVTLLLQCRFELTGLREGVSSMDDVASHLEWERKRHRPNFLLVSAKVAPKA